MEADERTSSKIKTLIFFDFETTGLIPDSDLDPLLKYWRPRANPEEHKTSIILQQLIKFSDQKSQMPKITEMSFISVPRTLFTEAQNKMAAKATNETSTSTETTTDLPIAVNLAFNVHTRQLNPLITEAEWEQYENTINKQNSPLFLRKNDLIFKNTFAQEWPGVHHFLELAPKPACLIAHNGIRFDYRLLHFELQRNQLIEIYPIPDGVYFLDSYLTFLDLEFAYQNSIEEFMKIVDWKQISKLSNSTTQKTNTSNISSSDLLQKNFNLLSTPVKKNSSNIEIFNIEKTSSLNKGVKRNITFAEDENEEFNAPFFHPVQVMNKLNWSPAKRRRIRKDLFIRSNDNEWNFTVINDYFLKAGNFRLGTLFKNIIKEDFEAHRAQADTEALLQVCLAYGKEFLSYLDKYSVEFPKNFDDKTNEDIKNLI